MSCILTFVGFALFLSPRIDNIDVPAYVAAHSDVVNDEVSRSMQEDKNNTLDQPFVETYRADIRDKVKALDPEAERDFISNCNNSLVCSAVSDNNPVTFTAHGTRYTASIEPKIEDASINSHVFYSVKIPIVTSVEKHRHSN